MPRHRALWLLSIVVLMISCILAGVYSFRRETVDNPSIGIITYVYRWGRRAWLLGDTNRDGLIDFRARTDPYSFPDEYWEDGDFDGVLERHAVMEGGCVARIEFDDDEDGEYERSIEGADARSFYDEGERPNVPAMEPCPPVY